MPHTRFESLLWGFIASIPLVIGCIVALSVSLPKSRFWNLKIVNLLSNGLLNLSTI
jgi:hypothetical protein